MGKLKYLGNKHILFICLKCFVLIIYSDQFANLRYCVIHIDFLNNLAIKFSLRDVLETKDKFSVFQKEEKPGLVRFYSIKYPYRKHLNFAL